MQIKGKIKYTISEWIVLITRRSNSNRILREYKNKFRGGRCFIICNGPSLLASDLDQLKDEITFASNRIYNIFDETTWRPTFYALFDEGVARMEGVVDGANSLDCQVKFLREQGWLDMHGIKGNVCYLHSWHDRKFLENPQFATDLCKGIYTIATVTYTMIEIARYMGFDEIYIIGADNKYGRIISKDGTVTDTGVKSYFGHQQDTSKTYPAAIWEMNAAYEFAERYSRKNGFRIYNATRGGYLEAFERVDFDSIIGVDHAGTEGGE